MSVSEIKSVWVCAECKSLFPSGPEMSKHLEGKKFDEMDCPKCGEHLHSWLSPKSIVFKLRSMGWLEDRRMLKGSWHEDDEHNFCEELVDWVEEHREEEEDD